MRASTFQSDGTATVHDSSLEYLTNCQPGGIGADAALDVELDRVVGGRVAVAPLAAGARVIVAVGVALFDCTISVGDGNS